MSQATSQTRSGRPPNTPASSQVGTGLIGIVQTDEPVARNLPI